VALLPTCALNAMGVLRKRGEMAAFIISDSPQMTVKEEAVLERC
jgi:hypothetical protein